MIDLNRFESVCDYFKSLQFFVLDTHMMNQVWKFLSAFFSVQPISAPARPLSRHYFRRHMYGKIVLAPVPSKPLKNPKIFPFPSKIPVKLTKSRISTIVLCSDSLDFYGISHLFCRHAFVQTGLSALDSVTTWL